MRELKPVVFDIDGTLDLFNIRMFVQLLDAAGVPQSTETVSSLQSN